MCLEGEGDSWPAGEDVMTGACVRGPGGLVVLAPVVWLEMRLMPLAGGEVGTVWVICLLCSCVLVDDWAVT